MITCALIASAVIALVLVVLVTLNRAKGGIESVHPLHGPELRALRPLQGSSPYVFTTETVLR